MSTLNEDEKLVFSKTLAGENDAVLALINSGGVRINCADEHGSTPLMQAAFKGNLKLCQELVARGADVNWKDHEHYYSPLMFAALSDNSELCQYLLDEGCDPHVRNSVGKTASELAAFCGQNESVYVINNFLPKSDVSKVLKNKNRDDLLVILTSLARSYNLHPIKIVMAVKSFLINREEQKILESALDDLMDMQMKQYETNEVMALKIHVIHFTTKSVADFIQSVKDESKSDDQKLNVFCKRILKDETNLNEFLKRAIATFPFKQSGLYTTIMASMNKDSNRSALNILVQTLLGPRAAMQSQFCDACHEHSAMKLCSKCKQARYCSAACQKLHWFIHSKNCDSINQN